MTSFGLMSLLIIPGTAQAERLSKITVTNIPFRIGLMPLHFSVKRFVLIESPPIVYVLPQPLLCLTHLLRRPLLSRHALRKCVSLSALRTVECQNYYGLLSKSEGHEGTIFGHEFSGVVAEVGEKVAGIHVRERVTGVGFRPCGKCFWCSQGKPHRCSDMALLGYQMPGAMAEYVAIPFAALGRNVFKLPEEVTFEDGATVEPLSISLFSVRRAQPRAEDTAAVLGAGVIGLGTVQALKAMGLSKVLVSGRRASRLEAARTSGADLVVDAAKEDPHKTFMEATSSMGADIVFECAGSPDTFKQAVAMVRGGGKIMLVGVYEQPLVWDPMEVIKKNITLIGCLGGNFPGAIEMLQSGKVVTRPFITHRFSLDQAAEAFKVQIEDRNAIKVMIKP
jgi:threonine dehydrogenase-like Zn-dependent dehydrogenase